ncbi:transcriptional regulator swi6 [Actinomortierella ambigua]|uniref:Transcriptional regulator swi6 n=1 Tax=Actinomortierella ambigua TaxID=1343610 RepID=A0A9P6UBP4_9FUNG|nr:transcriptional regulator swi6 [Actinomortierella ambigua]
MTSNIYTAIYSGVPVYETMCRGIAVMKRRADSYLNATQILKVAGIEKGKRTKILEREVLTGEHEKVQGGYGKYQGTWIPFQRGKELAQRYKVEPYLRALFDYDDEGNEGATPTKEMAHMVQRTRDYRTKNSDSPRPSPINKRPRSTSAKPGAGPTGGTGGAGGTGGTGGTGGGAGAAGGTGGGGGGSQTYSASSMTPSPLHPSFNAQSPSIPPSPQWPAEAPPRKRAKLHPSAMPGGQDGASGGDDMVYELQPLDGTERYRTMLMNIFLGDERDPLPDLLTGPTLPADMDIDLLLDDQGHTALHWAAALARTNVWELLVARGADVRRVNYNGESALVRAVLVTNNFDKQSFSSLLDCLHEAIPLVDGKNRTVLHHIVFTAWNRARASSAHYYMECLLEWVAKNTGDFSSIVDIQDKNGDTALTIAARVGDRYLCKLLTDVGANRELENKVGLKAEDFGIDDKVPTGPDNKSFAPRVHPNHTDQPPKSDEYPKRGKEIMSVVQKMVEELDGEFTQEIMARQNQWLDTRTLIHSATREMSEVRRAIEQYKKQMQQLAEDQQKVKTLEQALEEESQRTRNQKGYASRLRSNPNEDIDQLFSAKLSIDGGNSSSNLNPTGTGINANGITTTTPTTAISVPGLDRLRQLPPGSAELKDAREQLEREVIALKARVAAYKTNAVELDKELEEVRDKSSDQEMQCKKVIASCCKIPLENVDEVLVPLTLAVESDGASLDLSRVAGFMSRVKQHEGLLMATQGQQTR